MSPVFACSTGSFSRCCVAFRGIWRLPARPRRGLTDARRTQPCSNWDAGGTQRFSRFDVRSDGAGGRAQRLVPQKTGRAELHLAQPASDIGYTRDANVEAEGVEPSQQALKKPRRDPPPPCVRNGEGGVQRSPFVWAQGRRAQASRSTPARRLIPLCDAALLPGTRPARVPVGRSSERGS